MSETWQERAAMGGAMKRGRDRSPRVHFRLGWGVVCDHAMLRPAVTPELAEVTCQRCKRILRRNLTRDLERADAILSGEQGISYAYQQMLRRMGYPATDEGAAQHAANLRAQLLGALDRQEVGDDE